MKIASAQYLKQSQSLALTPKLQHSIQMLQMSTFDLVGHIQEQALENPFLQIEDTSERPDEPLPALPDPDLGVLQTESYHNIWTDQGGTPLSLTKNGDSINWIEETLAQKTSLKSHLLGQLKASTQDPAILKTGTYLIDLVDDDGFMRANLETIAEELNISVTQVLSVLSLLQTFDPVGVCARSLEESFVLQLKEKNFLTDAMNRILTHLALLPTQGIAAVTKQANVSREELKETLQILRTLMPRPAEHFHSPPFENLPIDVRVTKNPDGEWECELNETVLPKIYANSELYHDLKRRKLKDQDAIYLKTQMAQATWLVKAIHQRSKTILNVCQAIIHYQKAFFEKGPIALKAMGLKDIALELGIHESTVSRAIHHKYVQTVWGTFELKHFFASTVNANNEEQSNKSIQAFMQQLIDKEDKRKPLSDDQLVDLLGQRGIRVARRTVAKYREAMNIPSSFTRKKQVELMTF